MFVGGLSAARATPITPANVASLEPAWTFHTGELGAGFEMQDRLSFEATPVLADRTLYFDTATGVAFAIDAATGALRWKFDAHMDRTVDYGESAARGVNLWTDTQAPAGTPCAKRVLFAALDAHLFALDAATGKRCAGFGNNGAVDLTEGVHISRRGNYTTTSPPAVIGDTLVIGSSVGDNGAVDLELGVVRAFDARTGALRWKWDPLPVDPDGKHWTGAANAWPQISVDTKRNRVFVPTGSPSPDFFGGERPGDDHWADSVVALDAASGALVWSRQLVHHDLWDYDNPATPLPATVMRDGRAVESVIQATKTGQIFVFDRESGAPVFPIEERPVPQQGVPGEVLSPTQPFSSLPALVPHAPVRKEDAWGLTFWDRGKCEDKIAALRSDGIFTPPTLQGTIERPGYAGGSNWGGVAFDTSRQIVIANVMDVPMVVTLMSHDTMRKMQSSREYKDSSYGRQAGTPFGMRRELLASPLGVPCIAPPWGRLVALDLRTQKIRWSVPLGTTRDSAPWPFWWIHGTPNIGGPLALPSGVVFIAAALDKVLRAFRTEDGAQLWDARLPASGQATPMTYTLDGRQYVVIAAGGHGPFHTAKGDAVVAFALPH